MIMFLLIFSIKYRVMKIFSYTLYIIQNLLFFSENLIPIKTFVWHEKIKNNFDIFAQTLPTYKENCAVGGGVRGGGPITYSLQTQVEVELCFDKR